jgi:hypothetical protein
MGEFFMDWNTIVAAVARHILGGIATWLVAQGAMSADPSVTEQFIGGGMFLGTVGWSLYQKKGAKLLDEEVEYLRERLRAHSRQQAQVPQPSVK